MNTRSILTSLSAAFVLALFAVPASAAPVGILRTANCSGGGVIVDIDTIDWVPTVGSNDGCIQTGDLTNIVYSDGVLGPAVQGAILDLQAPQAFPVLDFMTFTGHPDLDFDLTSLGPGSANTLCGTLVNIGDSCSVFAGSPFLLTLTATGTSVNLSARGTVSDDNGTSEWFGAFTTQIAGKNPWQVQTEIMNGGQIRSTHSGEFILDARPIPEPASMLLFGTGLIGTALRARARRRRQS